MSLETGNTISILNSAWPIGASDKFNQGDDHLRLIKAVLLNQFSGLAGDAAPVPITLESADFNNLAKAILTDDSKSPGMTTTLLSDYSAGLGATFKAQVQVDISDGSLSAAPAFGSANLVGLMTASSGTEFGLYLDGKVTSSANYFGAYGHGRSEGSGSAVGIAGIVEQVGSGAAFGVEGILRRISTNGIASTAAGYLAVTTHAISTQASIGLLISNQNVEYAGGLPATVDGLTRALHIEGNFTQSKGKWDQGILIEDCIDYGIWNRATTSTFGEILDHKYAWPTSQGATPVAPSNDTCLLIRSGDWTTQTPGIPLVDFGIQVNGTFDFAAIRVLSNQGIAFDDNSRYQIRFQTVNLPGLNNVPVIAFWDRVQNRICGVVRMDKTYSGSMN